MIPPKLVSIHGGHSGQFCNHAEDQLEAIVQAYIAQGFAWVGITEHMPPQAKRFLAPDEVGQSPDFFQQRFGDYVTHCRDLQQKYAADIDIFLGFESETYSGYAEFVPALVERYQPDYFVGSLHHVDVLSF